jgi:CRISPR/Cas system CSM-associated protein Csm5 (group 7 of RAMP superfamily)
MHTAVRLCDCGHVFPVIKPKDEAIEKFIQVSKAIDVKKIIESKAHYKTYHSLHVLVEQVFNSAKKITPEITPIIQEKIHELARLWCKEKKRRFDQFHRNLVNSKLTQLCSSHTTTASIQNKPKMSSSLHFWKESEPANGRT